MNLFLKQLADEEIQYIVARELPFFLEPIKQNEKSYARYSSQLGTKKKDSLMVKRNLPKIATQLFRKMDRNYVKALEIIANKYASSFMQIVSETLEYEISQEELKKFSDEQIVDLLNKYDIHDGSNLDYELLWIQMKLVGFENVDERKSDILSLRGLEETNIPEKAFLEEKCVEFKQNNENKVAEQRTLNIKKVKARKLTPEEKAAKTKAAVEAKKKAKMEEKNQVDDAAEIDSEEMVTTSIATAIVETVNEEVSKEVNTVKEDNVSKYIGVISIKSNFYNFTPIGLFENGTYSSYTERELDTLLPKSNRHNINFFYNFWDETQARFMKEKFQEGQPILLNCEVDELDENRSPSGGLNPTGYKICCGQAFL